MLDGLQCSCQWTHYDTATFYGVGEVSLELARERLALAYAQVGQLGIEYRPVMYPYSQLSYARPWDVGVNLLLTSMIVRYCLMKGYIWRMIYCVEPEHGV